METRIKAVREAKGLTQREVARKLKTTSGVISRWENYPSRVNVPTLANLARVLDCSPADLLVEALNRPEASEETVVNIRDQSGDGHTCPFDHEYLARLTDTSADALVMVTLATDEMLPTLAPGDSVMVDTTVTKITGNGLYCLRIEDLAAIRRIAVHPVTRLVSVACDNPAYEILQDIRQENLQLIGRVIWRCGKV